MEQEERSEDRRRCGDRGGVYWDAVEEGEEGWEEGSHCLETGWPWIVEVGIGKDRQLAEFNILSCAIGDP